LSNVAKPEPHSPTLSPRRSAGTTDRNDLPLALPRIARVRKDDAGTYIHEHKCDELPVLSYQNGLRLLLTTGIFGGPSLEVRRVWLDSQSGGFVRFLAGFLDSLRGQGNEEREKPILFLRSTVVLEGGNLFDSEQAATKSNLVTLAVVVIVVLAILLGATWYFTRA
jgi:hypothetical protein